MAGIGIATVIAHKVCSKSGHDKRDKKYEGEKVVERRRVKRDEGAYYEEVVRGRRDDGVREVKRVVREQPVYAMR